MKFMWCLVVCVVLIDNRVNAYASDLGLCAQPGLSALEPIYGFGPRCIIDPTLVPDVGIGYGVNHIDVMPTPIPTVGLNHIDVMPSPIPTAASIIQSFKAFNALPTQIAYSAIPSKIALGPFEKLLGQIYAFRPRTRIVVQRPNYQGYAFQAANLRARSLSDDGNGLAPRIINVPQVQKYGPRMLNLPNPSQDPFTSYAQSNEQQPTSDALGWVGKMIQSIVPRIDDIQLAQPYDALGRESQGYGSLQSLLQSLSGNDPYGLVNKFPSNIVSRSTLTSSPKFDTDPFTQKVSSRMGASFQQQRRNGRPLLN